MCQYFPDLLKEMFKKLIETYIKFLQASRVKEDISS